MINKKLFKMKTIFGTAILVFLAFSTISCDDGDKIVAHEKLPAASKAFLTAYFNGIDITNIEKDGVNYSVDLASKVEVDFNPNGEWREVDGENGITIPTGFINPKIVDYVTENFPDDNFNGIEKTINGYDVELVQNGVDLIFDLEGNFLRLEP